MTRNESACARLRALALKIEEGELDAMKVVDEDEGLLVVVAPAEPELKETAPPTCPAGDPDCPGRETARGYDALKCYECGKEVRS